MNVSDIIDAVVRVEKDYVNDPADGGGETRFGITAAVARAEGYKGSMRDLPISLAKSIYLKRYVTRPKFDRIVLINADIGEELIDTGVNIGPHHATDFLQRWLNGFNDTGSRYQNLFVDGRIGALTLAALSAFLKWRGKDGVTVMMRALNGLQATRYLEITEADKSQRRFLFGWLLKRVKI